MSSAYRVAMFMLAIAPAIAQTAPQQVKPAPQATSPASTQGSSSAPAPKAPPAANSQRFVTSDNFYRPSAKPQPGVPASANATPAAATPVPAPAQKPVVVAPVLPQPVAQPKAPVAASAPPAPMETALVAPPSSASGSAAPAAVDYVSGQLTVVADNAPLGFVLNLIAAKTGAVIDLVPELQNEPVVARLGPASVREVMSALLDSPRIDYIVLGGGDETVGLQRVVVRMRHAMGLSSGLSSVPALRPPQTKQEEPAEEALDQNGHIVSNGRTPTKAQQRMQNWQRSREDIREAEIKQQAEERENDKNGSPDPPAPPQNNQPADPPQNHTENPPQL